MDDGNDGPLTRRRVLAGIASAAGVGLAGGAGTRAFLRDTETVPGAALGAPYEGARVDLNVGCGDSDEACSVGEDDGVSFAFEGVEPGSNGSTEVCPGLDRASEPAWLWFRTTPRLDTDLAEELSVTLADEDGMAVSAPDGTEAEGVSLKAFLDAFAGGAAIPGVDGPDGAFAPDEERCLELSWSLPADPDPDISEQSAEFTIRFVAVQYRTDAAARNPWNNE